MLIYTMKGGQSRDFFRWVAEFLGYEIHITEFAPFMAGVSQAGDTRQMRDWNDTPGDVPEVDTFRWQIGPPEMRFYWTVDTHGHGLRWFRASSGQAGVDPHLIITFPDDQKCLLERWKPATTEIVYQATPVPGDPMEGTP